MDESTLGSLRHRVPILDGEYFHEQWVLVVFSAKKVKECSSIETSVWMDERIEKRCLEGGE